LNPSCVDSSALGDAVINGTAPLGASSRPMRFGQSGADNGHQFV
jgi:hypothetical protein